MKKSGYRLIFIIPIICLNLSSCEEEIGPEDVLKEWLIHMQNGECEKASRLEVDAGFNVSVEFDCLPFERVFKSISCETREEAASCSCYEWRKDFGIQLYTYDLKKVDGEWAVAKH